jgi:biopolymer transport protein ExbD
MTLAQMESELLRVAQTNLNLVVWLRADENSPLKQTAAILNLCQNRGILCSLKTEPQP